MKETATYQEAIKTLASLKNKEIYENDKNAFLIAMYTVSCVFNTTFSQVDYNVIDELYAENVS